MQIDEARRHNLARRIVDLRTIGGEILADFLDFSVLDKDIGDCIELLCRIDDPATLD